jgi:phosphoglycolate phosphatase
MPYALAIFDLDGTLVDSFPWFRRPVNDVADRFGFRRIADDEIGPLRAAGSREILRRLQVPVWKLPAIARHMRHLKAEHAGDIALFPGVDGMLRRLADGGVQLALVTSDSEANARRQLGDATVALFAHVACGASLFGKAAKFRRVVKRAGIEPAHAIGIGDEVRDIEAARAAGIACAAVTWGYAAPEALRAHRPDLVFERVGDIAPARVLGRLKHRSTGGAVSHESQPRS